MNHASAQKGSVLFVVIMLLLLASVLTVFALNVGIFEQRTSGNDFRAKMVNEVADAGLTHGMEYLRQHHADIQATGKWELCLGTDTTFPCGTVPQTVIVKSKDALGNFVEQTVNRRSTMYRWNSVGYDFNGDGSISGWETHMLPVSSGNVLSSTGANFTVNYGISALKCQVAFKAAPNDPTLCTTDPAQASSINLLTVVSVARMPNEGARATLTQTVGSYDLINNPPGKPPVVASGGVDVTGGLQIVTNPNGAGPGVPVTVWTRKDVTKTGTPNTCYFDEFIRYGQKAATPATVDPTTGIVLCDTCQCPSGHTLSYDNSGNAQDEGIDILDKDAAAHVGANYDVKPEEFPCDLFEFVFGVKSWVDNTSPTDYFCETKLMTLYKNPNTGASVSMGKDEAYLYENAGKVIPSAATTAANLLKTGQAYSGTFPQASDSGLIWCQTGCDVGSNKVLGSPSKPVLLVVDGAAKIQGTVYGMIFLRSTGTTLNPTTGGDATLDMNAGAVVYGSVIVQGQVDKANGSAAIVYNADILTNLGKNSIPPVFGGVPGGWSDRSNY